MPAGIGRKPRFGNLRVLAIGGHLKAGFLHLDVAFQLTPIELFTEMLPQGLWRADFKKAGDLGLSHAVCRQYLHLLALLLTRIQLWSRHHCTSGALALRSYRKLVQSLAQLLLL